MTIPTTGGGERALGIPTVTDRVIQQAIAQVMTPIFDREFSGTGRERASLRASVANEADDLMVLVKSERAGQRVKANLTAYLDRQLKLPANEKKSQVAK